MLIQGLGENENQENLKPCSDVIWTIQENAKGSLRFWSGMTEDQPTQYTCPRWYSPSSELWKPVANSEEIITQAPGDWSVVNFPSKKQWRGGRPAAARNRSANFPAAGNWNVWIYRTKNCDPKQTSCDCSLEFCASGLPGSWTRMSWH